MMQSADVGGVYCSLVERAWWFGRVGGKCGWKWAGWVSQQAVDAVEDGGAGSGR